MQTVYDNKESCCGCTACVSICPKNAITMKQDERGFFYPVIDDEKCVNCNLCKNVCNFKAFHKQTVQHDVNSYAIRHKMESEVMTSRSGGFFSAVAQYVVSRGGICYGAALTSELEVAHEKADNYGECFKFKGSKYVQSRIDDSLFQECKELLESGKPVLFSGTGCQVHGLLSYLNTKKVDTSNLITIDFVCHGVPSPDVWRAYISMVEKREGKEIKHINFRDKAKFGWIANKATYTFADGSECSNSTWSDVFYQHCMIRESCYQCPYTTVGRLSDFTMGDYWGFEKVVQGYRDDKGLSFVIVQNEKAKRILNELEDVLEIHETNLQMSMQPQLQKPIYKGAEHNKFWKKWTFDKEATIQYFFFPNKVRRCYLLGVKKSKRIVKSILKKLRKIR